MAYALGYDPKDFESEDEEETSSSRGASQIRTECQYGTKCYRRNVNHLLGYRHALLEKVYDAMKRANDFSRIPLGFNIRDGDPSLILEQAGILNNAGFQGKQEVTGGKLHNGNIRSGDRDTDFGHRNLPKPIDMDSMDTPTLEKNGWMEPLGYRTLSEITGLPVAGLRKYFWASKVKENSELHADIAYYFNNSQSVMHGVKMRMKRVVNLKRYNENNCDYKDPNVQLLWHGTHIKNVGSIVTNGFQLPMHSGMFGRGVYFADRVSKSVAYCKLDGGRGSTGILFLCAVNLGQVHRTTSATSFSSPPPGFDSVMGCGINIPDPHDVRTHRGAQIPCGKTILKNGMGLRHNEFIVYDLSKIAILFLVEFETL